ncbi:hypothetical protein COY28_02740, partial [Candidatus Woesearchaeota archaeon CG_4_10_14_0_2_um_filter_57_5]
APSALSVSIEGGAAYTTSLAVALTLAATDASTCRLSNDNSAWTGWNPYGTTASWTLSSGNAGTRTVYYQCRSSDGLSSTVENDTIVYQPATSGPVVALVSPTQRYSSNNTVDINVSLADSVGINTSSVSITVENNGMTYDVTANSTVTGSGIYYIPTWTWNDGDHVITVVASSNASVTTTKTLTFGINTFSPQIYGVSPADTASTTDSTPLVNFKVSPSAFAAIDLASPQVTLTSKRLNTTSNTFEDNVSVYTVSNGVSCAATNDGTSSFYNCTVTAETLLVANVTMVISVSDASSGTDTSTTSFIRADANDTLTVSINPLVTTGYNWTFNFTVTLANHAGDRVKVKLADWTSSDGTATLDVTGAAYIVGPNLTVDNSYADMTDYLNITNGSRTFTLSMNLPTTAAAGTYYTTYGVKSYDTDAPSVEATVPTNGTYLATAPTQIYANLTDGSGSGVYTERSIVQLYNTTGKTAGYSNATSESRLDFVSYGTLEDGVFTLNVTPSDYASAADESGLTTYSYSFTLDTTLPAAFSLTGPSNNSVSNDTTPTFIWGASSDTNFANYTIYVDTATSFDTANLTVYNVSGIVAQTNYTPSTALTGDITYYWYVAAYDLAGNKRNSTEVYYIYIEDVTEPTSIELSLPANGTYTNNTMPNFVWTQTTDSNFDNYTIQVSNTSSFAAVWHVNYTRTAANVTHNTTTLADGSYYWRVIAYDSAGQSAVSNSTFVLTIDTAVPLAFNLTGPVNGTTSADTTPLFNWTNSSDTNFENYTLYIDTLPTFATANLTLYNVSGSAATTTFTPTTALTGNTTWYWYVAAYDKVSQSRRSSETYWVYVEDSSPPTAFSLSLPADGAKSSQTQPALVWSATTDNNFVNYTIQVSAVSSFATVNYTNIT